MKRTTLLATALALTATTLLTACGSSGGTGGTIDTGEDSTSKTPATDKPTPTSSASGRPHIDVAPGLELKFEPSRTGDKRKDAVLADNEQQHRAIDASINTGDRRLRALTTYLTGDGLQSSMEWIRQYTKVNWGVTGKFVYFNRKVTFNKDGSAVLIYCGDESKGFSKELKTGKVKKTPVDKNSFVLYNTRQEKDKNGVWQMSAIVSKRGAPQCQR